jgi:hypothetical protein
MDNFVDPAPRAPASAVRPPATLVGRASADATNMSRQFLDQTKM